MHSNKLVSFENPDKEFHEKWNLRRNLLNIPHPFRCVLLGPPNCGKTNIIKNLIIRAKPDFEQVIVIHCDPDYTQEYDDLGENCMIIDEIPSQDDFEGVEKTMVVLDDLEYKFMGKEQLRNLDRLFGYVSTHKNISVCLASQDPFNVPPIVRRCSNLWVLWKMSDLDAVSTCARRTGMKAYHFKNIFSKFTDIHDSLWIDKTDKTRAPLRKNGYTIIKRDTRNPNVKDKNYLKSQSLIYLDLD